MILFLSGKNLYSMCSCPPFECLCHRPDARLEAQSVCTTYPPVYTEPKAFIDIGEIQSYPHSFPEYSEFNGSQKTSCELLVCPPSLPLNNQARDSGVDTYTPPAGHFLNSQHQPTVTPKANLPYPVTEYNNNCMYSSGIPTSSPNSMPVHQQVSPQQALRPASSITNLNDSIHSSLGQHSPATSVDNNSLYSTNDDRTGPYLDDFDPIYPDNIFYLDHGNVKQEQRFDINAFLPSIQSFLGEEGEQPAQEEKSTSQYVEKINGLSLNYEGEPEGKKSHGGALTSYRGPSPPHSTSLIELQPVGPGKSHDTQALVSSLATTSDLESRSAFQPYPERPPKDMYNNTVSGYESISSKQMYSNAVDSFCYYNNESHVNQGSSMPVGPYHGQFNSRPQAPNINIGLTLTTYK